MVFWFLELDLDLELGLGGGISGAVAQAHGFGNRCSDHRWPIIIGGIRNGGFFIGIVHARMNRGRRGPKELLSR